MKKCSFSCYQKFVHKDFKKIEVNIENLKKLIPSSLVHTSPIMICYCGGRQDWVKVAQKALGHNFGPALTCQNFVFKNKRCDFGVIFLEKSIVA